jgi:tetraacyldisaccharide 4'-kinase
MKVLSVGNLTLGGTGKTPFVIMLAKIIRDEFKREPAVLIRGYGWDEQTMLKRNLADIPILVGENRVRLARRAIKLYGSSTAVLDDGFQYWELKRDLEIVLIDSSKPFGNGRLFPAGVLREPKTAVVRADIIVFTKVNKKNIDIGRTEAALKNIKKDLIFLEAVHRPKHLYDMKQRKELDLSNLKGKKLILLSSIGDPEYFKETIKDLGATVTAELAYPDHYDYRRRDIDNITRLCSEKNFDFIITTEKDAVKLTRLGLYITEYPVMTLIVNMEITKGRGELIDRLHSLYRG